MVVIVVDSILLPLHFNGNLRGTFGRNPSLGGWWVLWAQEEEEEEDDAPTTT